MPAYFSLSLDIEIDAMLFSKETTHLNLSLFLQDDNVENLGNEKVFPCFVGNRGS